MKLVTALTVAALMTAPTLGFAQGAAGGGTGDANSDGASGMSGNGMSGTGTGTGSDQMTPGRGRSSTQGQTSGPGRIWNNQWSRQPRRFRERYDGRGYRKVAAVPQ
jgi:hypothetical protein